MLKISNEVNIFNIQTNQNVYSVFKILFLNNNNKAKCDNVSELST